MMNYRNGLYVPTYSRFDSSSSRGSFQIES